jgi:hypothetical protein
MKNLLRRSGLMLVLLLGVSAMTFGQAFEGVIQFTKKKGPIVSTYKYYVKGEHIRVEEINKEGSVEGIMLVNTKENTVMALSPERKIYMDVPNDRSLAIPSVEVAKMKNRKELNGFQCAEWKVTNASEGRVVTYWVAEGEFDFFVPLLKTLKRKERLSTYFTALEGTGGMFPFEGTERLKDGTEVESLEVTKVLKGTIGIDMFVLPAGYTKFEK